MLIRQVEGSIEVRGAERRGYEGRYRSIVDWGGMECLKRSWVEACIIVSCPFYVRAYINIW